MRLILVNPNARRLRRWPKAIKEIERLAEGRANVLMPPSEEAAIRMLDDIQYGSGIDELFVVGGDGTFSLAMNWVLTLPKPMRPPIMPVGGGEICYMTRFLGMRSTDPLKNLRRLLLAKEETCKVYWAPLAIRERQSGTTRFAAVFSTAIVHRFIRWYEELGKGNMIAVVLMILLAFPSVLVDALRRWHGRLEGSMGELTLDAFKLPSTHYTGLVLSTVPVMIPWCWPFSGKRNPSEFYCAAYWGSIRALAFSIPWIWFGRIPPFSSKIAFNQPVRRVQLKTADPHIILDGDCAEFSGRPTSASSVEFHADVTIGPDVVLLGFLS